MSQSSARFLPAIALLLMHSSSGACLAQEDQSDLPFAGVDTVVVREPGGRQKRLTGRIEDVEGETVTFRHDGRGAIQFLQLDDVVSLDFERSQRWLEAISANETGDNTRALALFDQALKREQRKWAWGELQAAAAGVCIQTGQRNEAVNRIDQIIARDDRSRHVSLLPLVWDERLPQQDRLRMHSAQLRHDSLVIRLAAASALLHEDLYQDQSVAVLKQIRRSSGYRRLTDLAEAQLWRLAIVSREGPTTALELWYDRVRSIAPEARHGPHFVLGRCRRSAHAYQQAATSFLWAGLMSPADPALASQSLAEAAACLSLSGLTDNAAAISAELRERYPNSAAARAMLEKNGTDALRPLDP